MQTGGATVARSTSRSSIAAEHVRTIVRAINSDVIAVARERLKQAASNYSDKDAATLASVQKLETQATNVKKQLENVIASAQAHLASQKVPTPTPPSTTYDSIVPIVWAGASSPLEDASYALSHLTQTTALTDDTRNTIFWVTLVVTTILAWIAFSSFVAGIGSGLLISFCLPWYVRSTTEENVRKAYLALWLVVARIEHGMNRAIQEAKSSREAEMTAAKAKMDSDLASLRMHLQPIVSRWEKEISTSMTDAGIAAAPWMSLAWDRWIPAARPASGVRFGTFRPNEPSLDGHLPGLTRRLELPALLPFPSGRSLIVRFRTGGRPAAVLCVQTIMLRLLATVPPGQIRFTLVDPIGLGQTFASFMKLADHDASLVSARIWTEPRHIEQRLTDLTEHTENVIQKYLRNDYKTIEDYNSHAGETAEAYRLLVVADFPANFEDNMASRLMSIAANGPRCGVYVIILCDESRELPRSLKSTSSSIFQAIATCITCSGTDNASWDDSDFASWQLSPDAACLSSLQEKILSGVGGKAKEASKVEVPFSRIAPERSVWWSLPRGDSRNGIRVPLGPAGARKFQDLELGQGISHHALIVGRTGSGKSTLLHTLITNLALLYPPSEVELYLIDFKEGVEFKTYASHELPHARVIAIESEREFGLSVLQGLQTEHKNRGELFRSHEVQNIADFRSKTGNGLPRILLLVDEFQGFFAEDDQIASQARQILDTLARQGRAAGIHVLLGSQTLSGETLARSTNEQIAVRIALQCDEAASRQILAQDNPAARLLSRPGEAVYNSSNGLIEGNQLFQVALLTKENHDEYLGQVGMFAKEKGFSRANPLIVFEGNAPAELSKNSVLAEMISTHEASSGRVTRAWLGEPIAIRPPTDARFTKQMASNLLMVGQNEDAAQGVMVASLLSIAAHICGRDGDDASPKLLVLDFGSADGANVGYFQMVAELLSNSVQVVRGRQASKVVDQLHSDVVARLENEQVALPSRYLFVFGLQRARDFRQADGFVPARGEQIDETPQHFARILRDGPDLGIHTIVWCDSLANLSRTIDRRSMREFAMKVAFQMPAQDSSQLIDSQIGAKLGPHRAILQNEDEGRLEKFRPYSLPPRSYLEWMGRRLAERQ